MVEYINALREKVTGTADHPHSPLTRNTKINRVLPELAVELFDDPESTVKVLTCVDEYKKVYKSYVEIGKPLENKRVPYVSSAATQNTPEGSLEGLMMTLRNEIAGKEEKAMESARKTFGEALRS